MGKTNYQTANKRMVLLCIFPEPHDSSHRGSRALATRLGKVGQKFFLPGTLKLIWVNKKKKREKITQHVRNTYSEKLDFYILIFTHVIGIFVPAFQALLIYFFK